MHGFTIYSCLVTFIAMVPMMAFALITSHTFRVYDPKLVDVAIGVSGTNASMVYASYQSFLFAQYASQNGQFQPMNYFAFQPSGYFVHSVVSTVLPSSPISLEAGQHVVAVASSDMGSGASMSDIYWLRYDTDARIPRVVCYGPNFTSLLTSDFSIVSLDDPLVHRVVVLDQYNSTLYFLSDPTLSKSMCHGDAMIMNSPIAASVRATLPASPDMTCPWLAVSFAKELWPTSMAVDSVKQLVYVSCKGDHIIRILDIHTGALRGHFGWNGVGNGQLVLDSTRRLLYIHYPFFREMEMPTQFSSGTPVSEASDLVEHIHVLDLSKIDLPLIDNEAPCTFSELPLKSIYFTKPGERVTKMALDAASGILHLLSYYVIEPGVYLWTSYAPPIQENENLKPCFFVYVGDVVAKGLKVDPLTGDVLFYGYHRLTNTSTMFQFPFSRENCLLNAALENAPLGSENVQLNVDPQDEAMQEQIRALVRQFELREATEQSPSTAVDDA